jgi:hypothetical protein
MQPLDERSEEQTVSRNLFPPILGLVGIGLLAFIGWSLGIAGQWDELTRCNAIPDNNARLACYDKLASPQQPAKGAFGFFEQQPHERSQ